MVHTDTTASDKLLHICRRVHDVNLPLHHITKALYSGTILLWPPATTELRLTGHFLFFRLLSVNPWDDCVENIQISPSDANNCARVKWAKSLSFPILMLGLNLCLANICVRLVSVCSTICSMSRCKVHQEHLCYTWVIWTLLQDRVYKRKSSRSADLYRL